MHQYDIIGDRRVDARLNRLERVRFRSIPARRRADIHVNRLARCRLRRPAGIEVVASARAAGVRVRQHSAGFGQDALDETGIARLEVGRAAAVHVVALDPLIEVAPGEQHVVLDSGRGKIDDGRGRARVATDGRAVRGQEQRKHGGEGEHAQDGAIHGRAS